MATTISTQDIVDAKRDIEDIGKSVNEKVIVDPRYGEDFKSLPMIAAESEAALNNFESTAQDKVNEWDSAINLITQDGGVPALAVSTASGENQQDINDYNGVKWRNKAGGYDLNARVMLENGNIVRSTVTGNTSNPNEDLTGWDFVNKIVDFEALGGVGDGDYLTGVGTDNASAFALAEMIGERGYSVRFKHNARYKTTQQITVHNMNWIGDDNYTPIIFGWFSSSGKRIIKYNTSSNKKKVSIKGITFWRVGPNAEHGILIDNLASADIDVRVFAKHEADGVVKGGAIGISAFQPEHRPSTNVNVKAYLSNAANFGVQFGAVEGGSIQIVDAYNCMREVIGIEPYVQGKFDFSNTNVSSNQITIPNHGLTTGYPLIYCKLTAATNMLSKPNHWFAIVVDSNTIKLANSKINAMSGIAVTLTAPTGTHRLYKCGIVKDITILPSTIRNNNPPTESWSNADDGVVVITNTSGGYIENLVNTSTTIEDYNNRAPASCVSVLGADVEISGFITKGGRVNGIRANNGKLTGLRDSTGANINPPADTLLIQDAKIVNNKVFDFPTRGIFIPAGLGSVEHNKVSSNATDAVGISSTSAVPNFNEVSTPNGTPIQSPNIGSENINKSLDFLQQDIKFTKFNMTQNVFKKSTPSSGVHNLGKLRNTVATTGSFFGRINIIARHIDFQSANLAAYEIEVMKSSSSETPTITLIRSSGLVGGGGSNHPSFTFSVNSSNELIATPIGSTSTTADFYFTISTMFDLNIV